MTTPLRIATIAGDGIGPEVIPQAVRVVDAVAARRGFSIAWTHYPWCADTYLATGQAMPKDQVAVFQRDFDAILLGALGDPRIPDAAHAREILLGLRFALDLYINLRPIRCLNERLYPLKKGGPADVDFVVFRENTEGLYVNVGGIFKKGTADEVAVNEDVNTRKGVERIIRAAFDYAVKHGRRQVLMADKSNVLRYAHDLWQRVFAEVAKEYPGIATRHMYVDALTMEMLRAPGSLDVIVTNNLFGDIITDLGAMLQGGLGMAPSGNINPQGVSLFEPVHGSAPDIAGKGIANPLGSVLTAAMMLAHLGQPAAALDIEKAVAGVLADGLVTRDLGGSLGTVAAADAIIARLAG
jgi:3-isopropylmalate dehydrogenase